MGPCEDPDDIVCSGTVSPDWIEDVLGRKNRRLTLSAAVSLVSTFLYFPAVRVCEEHLSFVCRRLQREGTYNRSMSMEMLVGLWENRDTQDLVRYCAHHPDYFTYENPVLVEGDEWPEEVRS